jgi:hypothetical protein
MLLIQEKKHTWISNGMLKKLKTFCMKKNVTNPSSGIKAQKDRHLRPENKDNLDSRKNEEQELKADDITHNEKEIKSKKPYQNK